MTVAATQPLQTSADIPLADIAESPLNHRKYFDEAKLEELAKSIEAHGVLQPVLVRLSSDAKRKQKWELVYGHSRFRAAKIAGLKAIPATIRELSDRQVLEVALIENCRRQDIRAMEEAHAFAELHEKHGLKVAEIADQVGKSQEYVYARLKLSGLKHEETQKKLEAGKLAIDTALLIARIPIESMQAKFAEKVLEGEPYAGAEDDDGNPLPLSFRDAKDLLEDEFMFRLSDAPFDTKDAELVAAAGSCEACPKRVGNCAALYPGVKPNVCTDLECFAGKKKAHVAKTSAKAKEKGSEVLPPSRSKGVLQAQWDGGVRVAPSSGFLSLDAQVPTDPKRKWKDVLGKDVEKVVAIDQDGKAHDLVRIDVAKKAVKESGSRVKVPEPPKPAKARTPEDQARAKLEEDLKEKVELRAITAIVEKVETDKSSVATFLQWVALQLDEVFYHSGVKERRGWNTPNKAKAGIKGASESELRGIVFEMLVSEDLQGYGNGYGQKLKDLCKEYRVDLAKLEAEVRAAAPRPAAEAAAVDAGNLCGVRDGKNGEPCFHLQHHEGVHSNGTRTWSERKKAAAKKGGKKR